MSISEIIEKWRPDIAKGMRIRCPQWYVRSAMAYSVLNVFIESDYALMVSNVKTYNLLFKRTSNNTESSRKNV